VFLEVTPLAWEEADVHERFGKYGALEKVILAKDLKQSKRKDYGFVTFETREGALAAIQVTWQ
jgi:RNA recognition motif-containing protein